MKLFPFAMLLLVQLSPIFVQGDDAVVDGYKCEETKTTSVLVDSVSANLTNGCVLDGTIKYIGAKFDLQAMYAAAAKKAPNIPNTPVVIDITEVLFINCYIRLFNAHLLTDLSASGPLLFTMIKSNMSGTYKLLFGSQSQPFKLPPNSRICISESKFSMELDVSYSAYKSSIFMLHGLQLVNSSIEITDNVITMECKGCNMMSVFYLSSNGGMVVSDKSSFTLRYNVITMDGYINEGVLTQHVWYQDIQSPLSISENSIYTWVSNTISMVGYDVAGAVDQVVWLQKLDGTTPLTNTVSKGSSMTWKGNCIGMGHNKAGNSKTQGQEGALNAKHVFGGKWSITGDKSELLLDGNHITTTDKYEESGVGLTQLVWGPTGETGITINTGGKLSIQDTLVHGNSAAKDAAGSMVWNGPSFTSNANMKLPDMKWSSSTPAKLSNGSLIPTLDIGNLHENMCIGLENIPKIPKKEVKPPVKKTDSNTGKPKPPKPVVLSSVPKPVSPKPVPKLPVTPNTVDTTTTTAVNTITSPKGNSATAISSTIPAVLITSVVFLYLYNW